MWYVCIRLILLGSGILSQPVCDIVTGLAFRRARTATSPRARQCTCGPHPDCYHHSSPPRSRAVPAMPPRRFRRHVARLEIRLGALPLAPRGGGVSFDRGFDAVPEIELLH